MTKVWNGPGEPWRPLRERVGGSALKVRIGVGTGTAGLDGPTLSMLADDLSDLGFDSIWLSEVLTAPGVDPLVGLSWVAAHHPRLKLGTTMLLPGRHPVRLARQLASLDSLCGGRLLITFVPGMARGVERDAVGVPVAERGPAVDEVLPLLRKLWAGERVSHDGPSGRFADVSISPLPVQEPLEVWLGGMAHASLLRCGRLADGWLPSMCTPAEVAAGRRVVEESAARAGRSISDEHFGVSIGYSMEPLDTRVAGTLSERALGRPLTDLVPQSPSALRDLVGRYLDVGFSKFVVRPLVPPVDWRGELERLSSAVGDLQT